AELPGSTLRHRVRVIIRTFRSSGAALMPTQLDPRHAVYAGSFDPVTLGHVDIVRRGARLFDRLTVGIGINPDKQPLFSPEERVALMEEVCRDLPNVAVTCFEGLTVDFVRHHK